MLYSLIKFAAFSAISFLLFRQLGHETVAAAGYGAAFAAGLVVLRSRKSKKTRSWKKDSNSNKMNGESESEDDEVDLEVDHDGPGWRLVCPGGGRQLWVQDGDASAEVCMVRREFSKNRKNQRHASDRLYRDAYRARKSVRDALDKSSRMNTGKQVQDSILRAVLNLTTIQDEDGHIAADYGGPMFLLPGYAICALLTEHDIGTAKCREIRRYLQNHLNADGGWPMHVEGKSTVFGTALNYATYRILGGSANDPFAVRARTWLKRHGGAYAIPSWGKMWLALLGCYEWSGMNPLPPELWLVPWSLPIHPGRMWCFARTVYLPMGYLYATKPKPPASAMPLVMELRKELFVEDYDEIDWSDARKSISETDLYRPHHPVLTVLNMFLSLWEWVCPRFLREKALKEVVAAIKQEDEATAYINLGPVNKMLNLLVCHLVNGRHSKAAVEHWLRTEDYLWVAEDGMKMQGYNGCQTWDAAFSVQMMMESQLSRSPEMATSTRAFLRFLDSAQALVNPPDMTRFYRSPSLGGWGFSTREQGWIVSDCTGEALLGVLVAKQNGYLTPINDTRVMNAIDLMLSMQNGDGGWATCEPQRGPAWLELLNPSEVFGDIMIDYSHVECTSSVIKAMVIFMTQYPNYRTDEIKRSIARGVEHLKLRQRKDGSFKGFWAVCFTYGTWFAVEGLRAAGEPANSKEIERACSFLLSKQNADGGWGETHDGCADSVYTNCASQGIQTAWAVLTLLKGPDDICSGEAVRRGVQFLLKTQNEWGDWPQMRICGSFNGNCAISYCNFRSYFPAWALVRYHNMFGDAV